MPDVHCNAEPVVAPRRSIDITVHQAGWERAENELRGLKSAANQASHRFNYSVKEEPYPDSHSQILGLLYYRLVRHYHIDTDLPTKADQYELLGTLDHRASNTEVIIQPLPGKLIPAEFAQDDGGCDHCHTQRRRRTTFVLMSHTGEIVRVGSTCLREFIGLVGAKVFQWHVKVQSLLGIAPDVLPVQERLYKTADVHALAVALVRERGFVPVSHDDPDAVSTKSLIENILCDVTPDQWNDNDLDTIAIRPGSIGFTGDYEKAQIILGWASGLQPTGHYLHQLKSASQHEILPPQALAIVVSSVAHFEQLHIKRVAATMVPRVNKGIGSKDKSIEVCGALLRVVPFSKNGSITYVCTFRDEHGHALKWFSKVHPYVDMGTQLSLQCAVIRHEQYQGMISTVVGDCTLTVI